MSAVAVVGAQWGDEGKGKVVDLLAPYARLAVRYAGGANAGHTLVVAGEKTVLHLVPSAVLHPSITCVIGQGTVIDPETLWTEIEFLERRAGLTAERLVVAERAHVVMPHHKLIDSLREQGVGAIGTTKRGIGPAYEDKAARRGIRIADFLEAEAEFRAKLEKNLAAWHPAIAALGGEIPELSAYSSELYARGQRLRPFIRDAIGLVQAAQAAGDSILLEGAQGVMLDIDHGTYPYVTSSTAVAGGAAGGAGVSPRQIKKVIGITKAYTTRVGGGPFPTELLDATGDRLRKVGQEFGSTTGRPRRCGWLDAVALRYAVQVGGIDELAITKLDVLAGLPEIRIARSYRQHGRRVEQWPSGCLSGIEPVYETLPGFSEALAECRSVADLPANARRLIERISELAECKIGIVSVGPDRAHTIGLEDPFSS